MIRLFILLKMTIQCDDKGRREADLIGDQAGPIQSEDRFDQRSRITVEDALASQAECMSYSQDTKGSKVCISKRHNEAHEGCHNNSSGASQKAATQGGLEAMTHLVWT